MDKISFIQSKDNFKIPTIGNYSLHSKYNVEKEVNNMLLNLKKEQAVICLGLGAGHHIVKILSEYNPTKLIVITTPAVYKAYIKEFGQPNKSLDIFCFETEQDIEQNLIIQLHNLYQAIYHNSLAFVELRNEVNFFSQYFKLIKENIIIFQQQLQSDIATQAEFGKLWADNFFRNLAHFEKSKTFDKMQNIIIAAAGPSLETKIEEIKSLQSKVGFEKYEILAIDTAGPILEAHNIIADYYISIDPQFYTNYHYRSINSKSKIFCEFLTDSAILNNNFTYFCSQHPYSQLLKQAGLNLLDIDCSGGNASFSAVDLCIKLEAENIICYGMDFAIIDNKAYSNHSTYHQEYLINSNRINTNEGFNFAQAKPRNSSQIDNKIISPKHAQYRKLFVEKFNPIFEDDKIIIKNKKQNYNKPACIAAEENPATPASAAPDANSVNPSDYTNPRINYEILFEKLNNEIYTLPLAYWFLKQEPGIKNKKALEKAFLYHQKKSKILKRKISQ